MDTHTIRGRIYHSLKSRYFTAEGRTMEVIATDITGRGPMDCTHTVKGETETKQVKHKTLIALFKAGRLKAVMP